MSVYNWAGKDSTSLFSKIVHSMGVAPVVYDASAVESSVTNIGRHLEYLGYYDSKIDTKINVNGKKASVHYLVTLGKRYPISDITFSIPGGGEFAEDFMADTSSITIKKGDFLSEAALEAEAERSAAYLRNQGYYGFDKNYYFFEADTLKDPTSAALKMTVAEYTRNESPSDARAHLKTSFGNVSIQYPSSLRIKEGILKDLNTIKPGELYREDIVNNTYSRLSSMRIFNGVSLELTRRDSVTVDCDIMLTPSRLQGFKVNLEGSTNSSGLLGVSPEISYYHKNIFRGGEWLNLGFMGNFQFKPGDNVRSTELGVSSSISIPRFVFLPTRLFKGTVPRTEFNASYNYQGRPEYTRYIVSTSFGYTGSKGNFHYQIYPIQLNVVRLPNMDESFFETLSSNPFMRNAYQDHFDFGQGTMLYYTTDASANPKGSYHYARLQLNTAGNVLSAFKGLMKTDESGSAMIWNTPFSQYVRAELTLGKTWKIGAGGGYAVATRLVAGAGHAYGNSSALPFEQHFYAGGASSLRGWQSRSVGPGMAQADSTFIIPNQTGDMKLEANIEYRFPIVWKLAGALFLDAGNVWTLQQGTSSNDDALGRFNIKNFGSSIAANWGVGLRVDLNFILVRLDMGMKIHDPSRPGGERNVGPDSWFKKGGSAIHFGVGYPF